MVTTIAVAINGVVITIVVAMVYHPIGPLWWLVIRSAASKSMTTTKTALFVVSLLLGLEVN